MSYLQQYTNRNSNLFEIPEIVSAIAPFLGTRDLASCVRVSKAWNQLFMASLWKDVTQGFTEVRFFGPRKTSLINHANLVTSLDITGDYPYYLLNIKFPFLKTLELGGGRENAVEFSLRLITNNPTIHTFILRSESLIVDHAEFWEILSNLQNLKRLDLSCISVPPKSIRTYWKTLCHLESFQAYDFKFPSKLFDDLDTIHKMRNLSLTSLDTTSSRREIELFERCPHLEQLLLDVDYWNSNLVGRLAAGIGPNLHKITIHSVRVTPSALQKILSSITRLTYIEMTNAKWDLQSFNTLSRHFLTLKVLKQESRSFSSVMVNTVMCSCPNLKELDVCEIKGLDIINNKQINSNAQSSHGWVCTQLMSLIVSFNLNGLNSQIPVLESLAKLTQLEEWDMNVLPNPETSTIMLSLHDGLSLLKPMKSLKKVIAPSNLVMTEFEVEWIIMNWQKLDHFYGRLHPSLQQHIHLCQILKFYGIRTITK
ncbi:hypothetical protein BGZ76_005293 [Entomortierella beljakovae]|nr:hypothetical protein BGZ76_005293 [Entomortierella beljakovae]